MHGDLSPQAITPSESVSPGEMDREWPLRLDPLFLERKLKIIKIMRISGEISDYKGNPSIKLMEYGV